MEWRGTSAALAAALTCAAALLAPAIASAAKDDTVWLCKPGLAGSACDVDMTTTTISPSGQAIGEYDVKKKKPKADCFYVYPTVSDDEGTNSDRSIDPEERSIALYQAARYGQYCRVFAPMYRQITLDALFSGEPIPADAGDVGYGDVVAAWKTYLKTYNKGRGVILIGHSQGSFILRQLIAEQIDDRQGVRKRLIGAYLLGGQVNVKEGGTKGGDFDHVPACRKPKKTGCVIGFSTFNAPVPADARFGRTSGGFDPTDPAKFDILCNNPAALGGGSKALSTIFPVEPFAPGTTIGLGTGAVGFPQPSPPPDTTWYQGEAYTGQCDSSDDADVLQISPLAGAPTLNAVPDATWGLHLVDANIALGNLLKVAKAQIATFVESQKS